MIAPRNNTVGGPSRGRSRGRHRSVTWAYREWMKTKSPRDELARRLAERDELVVEVLELEGRLERAKRRLDEVSAEIDSSGHIE